MLRWVGVFVDLLCDHLAQPSVLGKPFPSGTSYGMPANFNRPSSVLELGLPYWHCIGHMTQADGMLQGKLAFGVIFYPLLS